MKNGKISFKPIGGIFVKNGEYQDEVGIFRRFRQSESSIFSLRGECNYLKKK